MCLFVDGSNVWVSARESAGCRETLLDARFLRLQVDALHRLMHAGRPVAAATWVGSDTPPAVQRRLRRLGFHVENYERGRSGKEQGVDQCLQVHMLRIVTDFLPGVVVVATGDGAGYSQGVGFLADLERLHNAGWGVEVLAWADSCSKKLRRWVEQRGVFVPLDEYYEAITFVEGGRRAAPLSLTHRALAQPVIRAA